MIAELWLDVACRALEQYGAVCEGELGGPLFRPPSSPSSASSCKRPVSSSEVTSILRHFSDDGSSAVSSHSLKATALSWATKASFDRDTCAILGRHARSVATSEAVYSRDLSGPATLQLAELLAMTAVGTFRPDAQFREFWPEDPTMQAHPEEGVKEEPPCMSDSSSDEGSSSSSGSDDDAAPAPVAKARRFAEANAPRANDQWVVRRKSKLLHLARGQSTLELHQRVLQCGRQMSRHFAIAKEDDLRFMECRACKRNM